ncbi:hypothetical protein [Nostoc sp.]|uniref:hypothetical protein n=1 Tax=Nostoc sp. TaxID=1180 RepID=UPI002FF90962
MSSGRLDPRLLQEVGDLNILESGIALSFWFIQKERSPKIILLSKMRSPTIILLSKER